MTIPYERSLAVKRAQDFLRKLLDPKATPRVPLQIRREARSILKHFPSNYEMDQAAKKAPDVFGEKVLGMDSGDLYLAHAGQDEERLIRMVRERDEKLKVALVALNDRDNHWHFEKVKSTNEKCTACEAIDALREG